MGPQIPILWVLTFERCDISPTSALTLWVSGSAELQGIGVGGLSVFGVFN